MAQDAKIEAVKLDMYVKICERAEGMGISISDRMSSMMDIMSADVKFCMRLDDWLNADDFNFAHDFIGIQRCIDRSEYPATNFGYFLPRFAGQQRERSEAI